MSRRYDAIQAFAILFFASAMIACSMRIGDFTVASSKNISQLSQKGDHIEGEDCSANLLGLIPLGGPTVPNFKTAVDKALEKAKGDVVADAVMWETKLVMIIFNQHCFKVEGKVARSEFGKKM
jgi:hypothetical protein